MPSLDPVVGLIIVGVAVAIVGIVTAIFAVLTRQPLLAGLIKPKTPTVPELCYKLNCGWCLTVRGDIWRVWGETRPSDAVVRHFLTERNRPTNFTTRGVGT